MNSSASRAGHWPLALTILALAACADSPVSPAIPSALKPNADIADPVVVANTNDDGIGSLRWVLRYATGGETIRFASALAGQTIAVDSSLRIRVPLTIEGPVVNGIILDGKGKSRVMDVLASDPLGQVTLRNLSITGGRPANESQVAGAIMVSTDATWLVIENSAIYGNAGGTGNVIYGGSLTMVNSTVSGNTASSAVSNEYGAVQGRRVELVNSTVSNNGGNGIGAFSGGVLLKNSIISNNPGKNCLPRTVTVYVRAGANISDDETCGGPTEIMIGDPEIGPLAGNGGPTQTHALLAGSPAINNGKDCSLTVDQRYVPRDTQCDIGAYEFTTPTSVTVTIDGGVAVDHDNGWAVVTGTVKCSRNESFSLAVQLEQQQKTGKTKTSVDAAATIPVECTTSVRPWVASMILTSGEFITGPAQAKAYTMNVPKWVTSAGVESAVKLSWARR